MGVFNIGIRKTENHTSHQTIHSDENQRKPEVAENARSPLKSENLRTDRRTTV